MASEVGRGRGGKKRHSSQPLGAEAKDARAEMNIDIDNNVDGVDATNSAADETWSQVTSRGRRGRGTGSFTTANRFGLLSQANSYPDRTMRSGSIASMASASSRGRGRNLPPASSFNSFRPYQDQDQTERRTDLGEQTRFVTPPPNGQMRDEFTVECQKLNDRPFKGSITFDEARDTIFNQILGFEKRDLYSIRMQYSGCPIVKYKLKQQTNIDDLISVEYFNLERRSPNTNRIDIIQCRILGIRGMQSVPHYDGSENDVRWIKIEGTDYLLSEEAIKEGLAPFGEVLTPVREDIYKDSDSEDEMVGNGIYSVKMKLARPVPQFLPMHGRRIRIYHSGITKLCTNCYGSHTRRQCRSEKVPWIIYVRDFMAAHENLGPEYYGRWWDIIDTEFPGYFDDLDRDEDQQRVQSQQQQAGQSFPPETNRRDETQPSQNPEYTNRTVDVPKRSRDPRIQKNLPRQQASNPPLTTNYDNSFDRQAEMSKLLSAGLTLTDAKKYIENMQEQREIERRMNRNVVESSSGQTRDNISTRGRNLPTFSRY